MKLIIFILLIIIVIVIFNSFNSKFKPGYSSKESEYILPKVYSNLINSTEANYILGLNTFKSSSTLGGIDESIRKSQTTWIPVSDPVYSSILDRLASQFNFNKANAEDLQVVKYEPGGFYKEHHDSCCDDNDSCKAFTKDRGQRIITILIYLNDDFEEGSTKFPTLNLNIKPPKYSGVVFYPLQANGNKCHPNALHTGTPVKSGIKYVCNIWVREIK